MNETRRLRHRQNGGYARGDETRRKIIEAAIRLFGRHGFEAASTRDIAALAGVNAPALQYYFENKEGLYRACAQWIADDSREAFEPAMASAREVLERDGRVGELIGAFLTLQRAVADRVFAKHHESDARLFFAREQGGGEPEIGTQILRERVREPLTAVNVALLSRITGLSEDDPLTISRSFSLYGQFLMFHVARASALAALGWDDIDAERAEFLKTSIGEQTRVLLEHWHRRSKRQAKG